jgi:transposase
MNAPDTALQGQHTALTGRLYMAFELGDKSWKLSLGDGVRGPSRYTVAAGDTAAVLVSIQVVLQLARPVQARRSGTGA